jgi:pimeloyl-ACP methyl ester carboxylesterase
VTESGWASLAIDQIGSGASDHPDPNALTFTAEAYVVSQLVTQLRTGHVGWEHRRFEKVVTVGHSMGGGTVMVEAGLYHDAEPDAVVVDDFLHATNLDWVLSVLRPHYVVANTLPAFKNLPDGYFTVQPRALFYDTDPTSPGAANQAVIARDTVVEDVGPAGMQNTLDTARDPRLSDAITAPVLIATGEQDLIGCDPTQPSTGPLSCATIQAVANRERSLFSGTSCLGIVVVAGGHDTALHPDAPELFADTNQWLAQMTSSHGPAQHGAACAR